MADVPLQVTPVPIEDIDATGTPSDTTFLRGDGTWSSPSESSVEAAPHAETHEDGGDDEINVGGLSGELADPQTPKTHASTHASGGSDAIKLDDLAQPDDNTDLNASTSRHGLLPKLPNDDAKFLDGTGAWSTPAGTGGGDPDNHHTSHENGGADEISVAGLSGELADAQKVKNHTHAASGTGSDGGGSTLAPATLTLPTATTPSQTADGQVVWDSDDDKLTVGTGSGRKTMMNVGDAPTAHASSHQNGGGDAINVGSLSGELAAAQKVKDHTHAATGTGSNGGGGTLSPATLNLPTASTPSQTADGQVVWDSNDDQLTVGTGSGRKTLMNVGDAPTAHASSHQSGGGDAIKLDDLAAADDNTDLNASTSKHGLLPKVGSSGTVLVSNGSASAWSIVRATAVFVIDGGGDTITTGVKGDLPIDFDCEIESVTLMADQSGSIVVQVWKDTYANYPPTSGDAIYASAPPTISSAVKSTDSTLTGWTKTISAGDTLRFNVSSVTSIQRVTVSLKMKRT